MADSESGIPVAYLRLIVTVAVSRLVLEIFAYDTDCSFGAL